MQKGDTMLKLIFQKCLKLSASLFLGLCLTISLSAWAGYEDGSYECGWEHNKTHLLVQTVTLAPAVSVPYVQVTYKGISEANVPSSKRGFAKVWSSGQAQVVYFEDINQPLLSYDSSGKLRYELHCKKID